MTVDTSEVEEGTTEIVPTGRMVKRLKNDVRFDEETGKFLQWFAFPEVSGEEEPLDSLPGATLMEPLQHMQIELCATSEMMIQKNIVRLARALLERAVSHRAVLAESM